MVFFLKAGLILWDKNFPQRTWHTELILWIGKFLAEQNVFCIFFVLPGRFKIFGQVIRVDMITSNENINKNNIHVALSVRKIIMYLHKIWLE